MKLIIQITLILFSATTFGQTQKTTTIKLSTGDCKKNEAYSWRADSILFYKLPEDTLIFKVIPRQYRQFPIKLDNIPVAEYKLKFKNNFKQLVIKNIRLTDQETNSIILCPDNLLDYPQNTLSKLQDQDTIAINFHSQGCFHTTVSKILISKQGDRYLARLYDVNWGYVTKKKRTIRVNRGDSLIKSVTMTTQNIEDFNRFENEINFVNDGGCTTTDWYDIKSKYLNIKATDGSCSWNGFYYLRKSFFGNKE